MPVYIQMPLNTTVNKQGEKNLTIRTGGNKKHHEAMLYD
jgi:hypothetical protein